MDDYDVMYLDENERNAVTDNRRTSGQQQRQSGRRIVVPASNRPTIIRYYGANRAVNETVPVPTQVLVQPSTKIGLAGMTGGELVELGAQILAAIQPLPGAPTAQGSTAIDVENLVTYQTALATHAKRDEQLRTLGNLIGRLIR